MKKILLVFPILLSTILCACNFSDSNYEDYQINNRILSKEAGIAEIKELLQVDSLYFFDCDFSTMPNITIVDTSYNISVWGQYIYDDEFERQIIDLSKQASVEIVANYRIESESNCFGFSVVSEVMSTGSNHYTNGVFDYATKNEIYTSDTFKSISDLKGESGDGTIYGTNTTINSLSVPDNFYPKSLKDSENPIAYFRKYDVSNNNIRVLYSPIYVVTHFDSYESLRADSEPIM